jgi:hypothetical protein
VMITTTSGVTVENYGRFGTGVNGGLSVSSVYSYDSYGNPVLSVVSVSNGLLGATGAYMAGVVITSATGIVTNQGTMGGA